MSKSDPEKDKDKEELLTPEEAPSGSKSKLKKLLIIIIPIVILVAGGVYFFFFVLNAPKAEEKIESKDKQKQEAPVEQNSYLDIDPIVVGLSQVGEKKEYLKIDMTLRIANDKESQAIMEKMPLVKDTLIVFLRSLRSSDFNSSSSTIYLREEITKRINQIVSPISIKEVLFQEITVN